MNPLLSMLGGTGANNPMSAMMQAIKMVGQIRQSGNPQTAFNQMAQTNPAVKRAVDMCKDKNPQQVFEQMCRQNGIDPAQITGMLR